MQTDRPGDRSSARLKQFQDQRLLRQNGKQNGMATGAKTQFNPLPFSETLNIPEFPQLKEAVCDQSTVRIETVTKQKLPGEATNAPFLGRLSLPSVAALKAVPTPILPEMSTLTSITDVDDSYPRKGVFVVLLPWIYRCSLICTTGILILLLLRLQGVLDH